VPTAVDEEAQMLDPAHIEYLRSKISDKNSFPASYYDPSYIEPLNDKGTAQVSAADSDGLAISITSTINTLFGSQIMVPETGIIMNNEMDDFSIPGMNNTFGFRPSRANLIRAGKRPLSSVSTIIVEAPNGQVYFVTGAAGGSRIPTATVQSIWNVIDRNMSTYDALKELRVHDQLHPELTFLEIGYDEGTFEYLKSLGHNVTSVQLGISAVHAVRRLDDGSWEAAGEPRQKNSAGRVV
jgi:gamma-glutamyltranspeptidase/glutathione hydrolase